MNPALAILIGLYSYLFPGNIMLMLMNLFQQKRTGLLIVSIISMLAFEAIYCFGTLSFLQLFQHNLWVFTAIKLFTFLLLLSFGCWMIFQKKENTKQLDNDIIIRGFLNMVIHPQQIPFFIAITALFPTILQNKLGEFVLLNDIGVFLNVVLYLSLGNFLINYFQLKIWLINKCLGGVYIALALYSLIILCLNL